MLSPMHKMNRFYLQGLIFAPAILFILWRIEIGSVIWGETIIPLLRSGLDSVPDMNLFFFIAFLAFLILIYINRRKKPQATIGIILGFFSCLCWYSTTSLWSEYSISPLEQRLIAVLLLSVSLWLLVSKSSKQKRRHFSEIVRREAIHRQNGRCKRCKKRLEAYGVDADHKDNNRANNKASNCVILCTPCHRRKHSQ
jgi:Na+/proline symporter